MKKLTGLVLSVLIGVSLTLAGSGDAYAKRLGGGKSFGSRPSYSVPYKRSTDTTQSASQAQQQAYQSSSQRNQAAREAMSKRGGLMGMLGGLALGGLLGALLFGGAFEHFNFLDFLVFALIAFMLFRLFAARRRVESSGSAAMEGYQPGADSAQDRPFDRAYQRQVDHGRVGKSGFDTDVLFGRGGGASSGRIVSGAGRASSIPADFDSAAFLSGARAAYEMMQKAWDEGDLVQLRTLTTDKVFGELQDQLRARGNVTSRTELLKIEVELLEARDQGADREATVLFDVIMRESSGEQPAQVREVWHFVRSKTNRQPTWFLDGIQQLED